MKEQTIKFKTTQLAESKGCPLELSKGDWKYEDEYEDTFICNFDPSSDKSKPRFNIRRVVICTQTIMQKWLREENDLIVIADFDCNKEKYFFWIMLKGADSRFHTKGIDKREYFDIYEEALEAGIVEALETIKP